MKSIRLLSLATVFALLAVSLSACFVPVPPTPVTFTPTPAPVQDWEAIQDSGEIVIGTSADYPPFSYYDDTFRITGFDPELMRALGERMGLEVRFRDIPFEGLPDALDLRQADALIAAISVTPEREAEMDFTDVYYIGEDAFLVAEGATLGGIQTLDEVERDTLVGVQEGSTYQAWLEKELIEPGLLSERNLVLYSDVERAVNDLKRGRVDVVVMDALPAQRFVDEGGVEIAAQGLNRQRYAIAVRTGSDDLRRALNAALDELRNDGTLSQLISQHLGLEPEEVLPLPTVATVTATPSSTPFPTATSVRPTSTPLPPPPTRTATATPIPARCVDGMAWVSDLTFDDKNMTAPPVLSPGQAFIKGWRVRNTGTCTWDNRYRLAYANGNTPAAQMGGLPVSVVGTVPPGATYDFYVQLVAPIVPGTYQGFWQMYNNLNQPFGTRVWVGIRVPAPVTATPQPTQTPAPQIDFRATPNNIRAGDPVYFTWNVQNVREVYFYRQGQNWWENGVAGQGSRTEYPSQTTSYFLRVVKRDGAVEVREEVIYVEPAADAPEIRYFSVVPEGRILLGQCVDISWDVRGDVDDVDITRNGDDVWDDAPNRGNTRDCPSRTGNYEYRLDASGPGGRSRATRTVEVVAGPTPTPTPTTQPTPPTPTEVPVAISLFSVTPAQVQVGQCVVVSWAVIGDPGLIQIKRNGAVILDNVAVSGSVQDCPTQANSYIYRIEATKRDGALGDAREATAVVTAPPTATPTATPTQTSVPAPPTIEYFNLSAPQIVVGECVTLSWAYSGADISAGNISRSGVLSPTAEVLLTDPPPVGDYPDCPPAVDTYTYRLKVSSEFGGTSEEVRTLVVEPPPVQPR